MRHKRMYIKVPTQWSGSTGAGAGAAHARRDRYGSNLPPFPPGAFSSKLLDLSFTFSPFFSVTEIDKIMPNLLMHNSNVLQQSSEVNIALFDACKEGGNVDQVKTLLAAGANPNWYNNQEGGKTALHAAAHVPSASLSFSRAAEIVQELISHGAVTSVLTLPDFNLPLHFAASAGNAATLKILIESQEYQSGQGMVPPVSHSTLDVTPPLTGCCARQGNVYGNTPLHETCITGNEEVTK